MRLTFTALLLTAVLAAPAAQAQQRAPFPRPTGSASILDPGQRVQRLFNGGCVLTEGPAAGPDGAVYFTDINDANECTNRRARNFPAGGLLWRHDIASGRNTVFRRPSGQANGLLFDFQERLIAAEGANNGGRVVSATNVATKRRTVLAAAFERRPFNSPNDLALDRQGRIYFTDPRYNGAEPLSQPLQGVYRLDPNGRVTRIIIDASKPNGVAISPDQRTLYVAVNDNGIEDGLRLTGAEAERIKNVDQSIYAYPLRADGTVGERRPRLVSYLPEAGPDGMDVDAAGNLYVAVRDENAPGIYVYTPRGRRLARIPTGRELPTNMAFGRGANSNVLYITAGFGLYRLKLNARGYEPPERTASP